MNASKLLVAGAMAAAILLPAGSALAYNSQPSCPVGSCIKMDGSTTVFPIAEVNEGWFQEDTAANASVSYQMTDLGSNDGQQQIMAGSTDVGMSSSSCSTTNQGRARTPAAAR